VSIRGNMRLLCVTVAVAALPSSALLAQDYQQARLVDIAPYIEGRPPIIAPNNGYPMVISTDQKMVTITVELNGMSYSADFHQSRDFKSSTLIVGDSILARLVADNLVLKKPNGKEIKAKVTRRARAKAFGQ